MKATRLLISNLYWYIRSVMETNGMQSSDYKVLYAYPDTKLVNVFPTISIDRNYGNKVPIEIGGRDWNRISVAIDVFANSHEQKHDISDLLSDYFDARNFTIYDFSNGYPTIVGDYTGIPSLGEMYVQSVDVVNIQPLPYEEIKAEKHHDMIIMDVILPVV